jgi:hypothetical protein
MALREPSCPICDADLPLSGDEKKGDEVFCGYCGAPCRLTQKTDSEDFEADEDL